MPFPTTGQTATRGFFRFLDNAKRITVRLPRFTTAKREPKVAPIRLNNLRLSFPNIPCTINRPYICGDFHPDRDVPDYCEGCKMPRKWHTDEPGELI